MALGSRAAMRSRLYRIAGAVPRLLGCTTKLAVGLSCKIGSVEIFMGAIDDIERALPARAPKAARSWVSSSSVPRPSTEQNCLGRSSPAIWRVRDLSRVPSPPAKMTAHSWSARCSNVFARAVSFRVLDLFSFAGPCNRPSFLCLSCCALLSEGCGAVIVAAQLPPLSPPPRRADSSRRARSISSSKSFPMRWAAMPSWLLSSMLARALSDVATYCHAAIPRQPKDRVCRDILDGFMDALEAGFDLFSAAIAVAAA